MLRSLRFLPLYGLFFTLSGAFADDQSRTVTILPTTDTSEFGLAEPLQNAYGQLLQAYGIFRAQLSGYTLASFTSPDIAKAFGVVHSDALGFVYMEKQRVSVFLFDSKHPQEFLVAYRLLLDPPSGQLTSEFIEARFREAVYEVVALYSSNQFQTLPGQEHVASNDSEKVHASPDHVRRLFRELASIEDRKYYVGADVGMARFSTESDSASTINFGGYGGARLSQRISAELGFDIFSYALLHLDGRYLLPFAEKYVALSLSAGIARFMGSVTDNRGISSTIPTGEMVFGPGVGFDIPLLGANLRGELRFYTGSANVLLGSYGIVYSL